LGAERLPVYVPCNNVGGEHDYFTIDPLDWAAGEDRGDILGVVHSHTHDGDDQYRHDQAQCELGSVPWWVFSMDGTWKRLVPASWNPLGHAFVWGVQDCYTVATDMLELPDFLRRPEFWRSEDLFTDGLASGAATVVGTSEPEPGDLIVFNIRGVNNDHCAVYIGNGMIAHQPFEKLGVVENMGRLVESVSFIARPACKKL
jgi:proteasome lid subunit RPN8/RPN11